MEEEEWSLLDKQVLGVIRLTLIRSVAHNVVKEKTTVDLMKALSSMYEKPSANNKVHLMMVEGTPVAQHLNEFNTITNQLSFVDIDFDDEICALIILASFPNSWEAMRMEVSNSTGKRKLKYDDIRDLILMRRFIEEMLVQTKHKIKLLLWRIGAEIEVEGLMIRPNPMTSHSQKVDLSLKRWENVSIVGKRLT